MKFLGLSCLLLCGIPQANAWGTNHEKVKLQEVTALTLVQGRQTTGRRSSPMAQLTCNGHLCHNNAPDAIQCRNVGWDGSDVQWECYADLVFCFSPCYICIYTTSTLLFFMSLINNLVITMNML